ncbi:Uncharacterised protein [Serratia proteamaculans]|nr:Uncharacterised protein [Serratia proteamaculans]
MPIDKSALYVWLHYPVSAGEKDNHRLLGLICDSYALSGGVYGYRKIHGDLREIGEICSKNRVAKIMKKNKIQALHGYRILRGVRGRASLGGEFRISLLISRLLAKVIPVRGAILEKPAQGNLSGLFAFAERPPRAKARMWYISQTLCRSRKSPASLRLR